MPNVKTNETQLDDMLAIVKLQVMGHIEDGGSRDTLNHQELVDLIIASPILWHVKLHQ